MRQISCNLQTRLDALLELLHCNALGLPLLPQGAGDINPCCGSVSEPSSAGSCGKRNVSLWNINLVKRLKCAHSIGGRIECLDDKDHSSNMSYLFLKGKGETGLAGQALSATCRAGARCALLFSTIILPHFTISCF